jgi:hypothetical protein
MFGEDFTFSKKQLGILFVVLGVAGLLAILSIDILDAGREGGIGPAQRIAISLTILLALIGLTLIPLGDDSA